MLFVLFAVPAAVSANPGPVLQEASIVEAQNANLRSEASTSGEVVGSVSNGTNVNVHEILSHWAYISTDSVEGYITLRFLDLEGDSLEEDESESTEETSAFELGPVTHQAEVVDAQNLNVRPGPSISYDRVGTIPQGTIVDVHEELSHWALVSTDSIEGYVSLRYLKNIEEEEADEEGPAELDLGPVIQEGVVEGVQTLNVRQDPSTSNPRLGTLSSGTTVNVHEILGSWALISTDSIEGYVGLRWLDLIEEEETPALELGPVIQEGKVIEVQNLNVRPGPTTSNTPLGSIPNGTTVNVHEILDSWALISTNSIEGYISLRYLELIEEEETPALELGPVIQEGIVEGVQTLNVRQDPSTSNPRLGTLSSGTTVNVHEVLGSWALISTDSIKGYVGLRWLNLIEEEEPEPGLGPVIEERVVEGVQTLNVRPDPSTSNPPLGTLSSGTTVNVHEVLGSWARISTESIEGYVGLRWLEVVEEEDAGNTDLGPVKLQGTIVEVQNLNVRPAPTTSNTPIGTVANGSTVNVHELLDNWALISTDSIQGYVSLRYLELDAEEEEYKPIDEGTVVEAQNLNVRSGPATSYDRISTLPNGTSVDVLKIEDGWALVSNGDVEGYVSLRYLELKSEQESSEVQGTVVDATNLNVRSGPSTSNDRVGTLPTGTTVTVHEIEDGWARISTDSLEGYVSMRYLDVDGERGSSSPTIKGLVIDAANLNVRTGPSTSYDRIGTLPRGTEVDVLEMESGWAKVSSGSIEGYVSLLYLQVIDPDAANTLQGRTIVIDPGHGGSDPGAVANGLQEKEIVLDVSLRLETKLKAAGANVVMTRRSDWYPSLGDRVRTANGSGGDIFISVHANAAAATSASGTETFFNTAYWSGSSRTLADSLQKEMVDKLNTRDRGVKQANFYVIRNTTIPSVLVELGFMTNYAEAQRMKTNSFRNAAADALYEGIIEYYN
jgi:N-acetylmuramoyl-L-alanine amidase